jgi:hypothetical protein
MKAVFAAGGTIPGSTLTALGTKSTWDSGYANANFYSKVCAVSGQAGGTVSITFSCTGASVTCALAYTKDSGSNTPTITGNTGTGSSMVTTTYTHPTTDPCTYFYLVYSNPDSNAIGFSYSYS